GYQTLALMQQGNLKLADGNAEAAAKLYDQAAATAPNLVIGDLARLKAADALLDVAPYAQLQTRLTPLTAAKRPYAIYAKEALAMAALMVGRTDEAKRDFTVIQLSLDAPEDMRRRAEMAVQLIDSGEAATAVAAAKATPTPVPTMPTLPGAAPTASAAPAAPSSTTTPPAGARQ
ncbi:MAG: tetratricopeptide repeat protein, partial [Caulobacteraceae bacterium]